MADVPTKQTLLELLVVSQLDAVKKQRQTLKTLPVSEDYVEIADSLRSEIASLEGRAARLSQMINPGQSSNLDHEMAA